MDSHGAHATAGMAMSGTTGRAALIDVGTVGPSARFERKMRAPLRVARIVRADARALTAADVGAARDAGATDGDVQLAVLFAAGFSMCNRMVDGLRARTAPTTEAYRERAGQMAELGYRAQPAIPGPR